MKCLVTGHKGYIGNKIYNKLIELNYEVKGVDLKEGEDILCCLPNEQFDYVFHLAALPRVGYSVEHPSYALRHNVMATSKLLEWSKNHGVKRFIFSSSSAVTGDGEGPTSPYGLHKLMSEMECKLYSELYDLDTVCLRYFNVFSEDQEFGGSYSTIISAWMEMIRQKKLLRLDGDGAQSRDFIHVEDIVDINLFCMNYNKEFNGKVYDVGSGTALSVNDIKNIVQRYNNVEFWHGPERKGDPKHTKANIENLKNIGWTVKINPIMAIHNCFNAKKQ
jgi:UDP-glucose 4-epimerase